MKIKWIIRNKKEVSGHEYTLIEERPILPPKGMVFAIGKLIDEAYVDDYYGDIPAKADYDFEIYLHTDDNDGLEKLPSIGWTPNE
jgi:hypothetical protein